MAIHLTECAAITELPASKKLVLMACADAADKDTRIAAPGFDNVMAWSGLKRSRALEVIAELVAEGYLVRRSSGRSGRRAEFYVFPKGCCAMHGPLAALAAAGSAQPDPEPEQQHTAAGSAMPDPTGSARPDPQPRPGSGSGSGLDRTPSQQRTTTTPLTPASRGTTTCTHGARACRRCGTNPRAVAAAEQRTARDAELARAGEERRARLQAIAACGRCSKAGYLPGGKVCDHDPEAPTRAARGLELVRAELGKSGRRSAS